MFDIGKLCELTTKKSSYYSFSYDKKEDHFVAFKAYGNMREPGSSRPVVLGLGKWHMGPLLQAKNCHMGAWE